MGNKLDSFYIKPCNSNQQRSQWQQQHYEENVYHFRQKNPQQNLQSYFSQNPANILKHLKGSTNQPPQHNHQLQHKPTKSTKQQGPRPLQRTPKSNRHFFKRSSLSSCPNLFKENSINFNDLNFNEKAFKGCPMLTFFFFFYFRLVLLNRQKVFQISNIQLLKIFVVYLEL